MRTLFFAFALLALSGTGARANITVVSFKMGGMVLEKTTKVKILEEDLRLSPFQITVRYRLQNLTDNPIRTRVAFPLPKLDIEGNWHDRFGIGWQGKSGWNPVDFSVRVNENAVEPSLHVRANVGKRDISEVLRKHNIPPTDAGRSLSDRLNALTPQEEKALVAAGALKRWGASVSPSPTWNATLTFHWDMEFAASRETSVEISYKPLAGGANIHGDPDFAPSTCLRGCENYKPHIVPRHPCRSDQDTARLQTMYRTIDVFAFTEFGYVLKTGRNWAGPIERFRLTLDTLKPDAVLDFCPPPMRRALRRTGPSTWTFEATNFTPAADIDVNLYTADDLEWPN